ncbi:unnamed protein product [Effrenium voratum]|uniref:EF-hand domain-containing protein n=1 Tax=Effrenium voratum TaxID=2562239 RepID=A0AA36NHE5_9DINO|nr:unnamed protein product [Effrenium voratum]CAJ1407242.1 unnamed protein product [Effrenium voratum]
MQDHLLLPSPYHSESRCSPIGLLVFVGFGLCALKCCGEERYKDSQELKRLAERRKHIELEDLLLEATELVFTMKSTLQKWPEEQDATFIEHFTQIMVELAESPGDFDGLWDEVRRRKQAIADCAGNVDEQLTTLAQRTHFSLDEITRLRIAVETMKQNSKQPALLDLDSFKELVKRAVPQFPTELCGRLFTKLDCFSVGRLAFVELACGMSALALGTMDEKLQVCFDLFDSEGRGGLMLSDVMELCATLFRVALIQSNNRPLSRGDEVIPRLQRLAREEAASSFPAASSALSMLPMTPPTSRNASLVDRSMKQNTPYYSLLCRLLAAAKVQSPEGRRLVAFEDFATAARMEPALLCLFTWCQPKSRSSPAFMFESTISPDQNGRARNFVSRMCCCICNWLRGRS